MPEPVVTQAPALSAKKVNSAVCHYFQRPTPSDAFFTAQTNGDVMNEATENKDPLADGISRWAGAVRPLGDAAARGIGPRIEDERKEEMLQHTLSHGAFFFVGI